MGVVGREGVEVSQLTQATLNVGHMDLHIVLEAAVECIKAHSYKPRSLSNRIMTKILTKSILVNIKNMIIQHCPVVTDFF